MNSTNITNLIYFEINSETLTSFVYRFFFCAFIFGVFVTDLRKDDGLPDIIQVSATSREEALCQVMRQYGYHTSFSFSVAGSLGVCDRNGFDSPELVEYLRGRYD